MMHQTLSKEEIENLQRAKRMNERVEKIGATGHGV